MRGACTAENDTYRDVRFLWWINCTPSMEPVVAKAQPWTRHSSAGVHQHK